MFESWELINIIDSIRFYLLVVINDLHFKWYERQYKRYVSNSKWVQYYGIWGGGWGA